MSGDCPEGLSGMDCRRVHELLDDYLDGLIDAPTLARETLSEDWGATGGWLAWYQPIVDAANAPRSFLPSTSTAISRICGRAGSTCCAPG